jgi:hypothetical protein
VFRLASPKGDVYDVFPSDDLVQANQGVVCSCPDHEKRHAGLPTKGCKHANALRAVGLLPSVVLTPPIRPDGSDDPIVSPWFDEFVAWIPGEDSAAQLVVSSDRGASISDLTPEPPVSAFLGTLPPVCGAEVDEDEEAWDTERFARERRPIPTIQRRSTTLLRKAIERLPYGSSEQNQAADGFWDRYMAWMDRNDSIEGYRRFSATQYFRKVTLTDVWYMAHQRWLYRRDLAEDVAKESAQPKLNAYRIRWRRTPRARRVVEWIGFGESVEEFRKESETDIRQDNPQAVILSCEPTDDPRNS